MKVFKRIAIWTIISLLIQFGGLFWADKVLFAERDTNDVTLEDIEKPGDIEKNIEIPIPKGASNIQINSKGRYISYESDGEMYIASTKDGKVNKYTPEKEDDGNPKYSFWFANANTMQVFIDSRKNGSDITALYTYNANKNTSQWVNPSANSEVLFPTNFEILDVAYSKLAGVGYIKAKVGGKEKMYSYNRNNNFSRLSLPVDKVTEMKACQEFDDLAYMGENTKTVRFARVEPKKITFDKNIVLLDCKMPEGSKSDHIYVGVLENDEIVEILHGTRSEDTKTWKSIKLDKPVAKKEQIYITNKGYVYVSHNREGYVKDYTNNKKLDYTGNYVAAYDGGILTINSENVAKIVAFPTA